MNPYFLTPRSAALVLAYLQHYTCKFLPGRCLAATHLNGLAGWLGVARAKRPTLRAHPVLASHLAVLMAAELVSVETGGWVCTPGVMAWLKLAHREQVEQLLMACVDEKRWTAVVERLNLLRLMQLDRAVYIQQTLTRQLQMTPPEKTTAVWQGGSAEEWHLQLPGELPLWVLFHLLQVGEWRPGQSPGMWLAFSPVTLGRAMAQGYSPTLVEHVLMQATESGFSAEQQQQMGEWYGRLQAYQIRTVQLLSTRQAGQLAAVMGNGWLRRRVLRQISPRHAVVSAELVEPLQRWLAEQEFWLDAPTSFSDAVAVDPAYTWLALWVLRGLGELVELPVPFPYSSLEAAERQLNQAVVSELEAKAEAILEGLRQAIRGRDAFFVPERGQDMATVQQIRQAIERGEMLDIWYQAVVDKRPYERQVSPLRLEERGGLYYLVAYCYLAEADRVFRVDRIHRCEATAQG